MTSGDIFVKIVFDSYKLNLAKVYLCLLHAKSSTIPSGQFLLTRILISQGGYVASFWNVCDHQGRSWDQSQQGWGPWPLTKTWRGPHPQWFLMGDIPETYSSVKVCWFWKADTRLCSSGTKTGRSQDAIQGSWWTSRSWEHHPKGNDVSLVGIFCLKLCGSPPCESSGAPRSQSGWTSPPHDSCLETPGPSTRRLCKSLFF